MLPCSLPGDSLPRTQSICADTPPYRTLGHDSQCALSTWLPKPAHRVDPRLTPWLAQPATGGTQAGGWAQLQQSSRNPPRLGSACGQGSWSFQPSRLLVVQCERALNNGCGSYYFFQGTQTGPQTFLCRAQRLPTSGMALRAAECSTSCLPTSPHSLRR